MNGQQMQVGLEVLGKHGRVYVSAEHDQIWLHVDEIHYDRYEEGVVEWDEENEEYKLLNPAPLTAEDVERLRMADWHLDPETLSWSHFC